MAAEEEDVEGIPMPPGDPDGVEGIADVFAGVAGQLRGAATRLRAAPGEVSSWRGASSVAFAGTSLVAAGDADDRAQRMERASAAARRFAGDLREARAAARRARSRAREARARIDTAEQRITDATGRREAAEGRATALAATLAVVGTFGAAPTGVERELERARGEAEDAAEDERRWKLKLADAEDELEAAQKDGEQAREDAAAATRGMRGALAMLGPADPLALATGGLFGASPAGGASPAAVATFFKRLGPGAGRALARSHPEAVGPLDGAPVALRFIANRELAEREVARLEGELDESFIGRHGLAEERQLEERLEALRPFTAEDRQLLLYDPRGDGQVAEVFGDLQSARHATVLVPGIGNEMSNFDGEFRRKGQNLQRLASRRSGGRAATVAWLGYDSPTGPGSGFANPDTYRNEEAYEGGASLARTLAGIDAINPGAHTTVAGHSYGSVVAGQAAVRHGLRVDDIVLTGSPGAGEGVDHASDLADGGRTRVWAAKALGDPIASGGALDPARLGKIHGPDPAIPEFGARRFDTGESLEPTLEADSTEILGVTVHYPSDFNPGSLIDQHTDAYSDPRTEAFRNLARIAIGDRGAVTAP